MPVLEAADLKAGEMLAPTKELFMWDGPQAGKQLSRVPAGTPCKICDPLEFKEGFGQCGYIKVECAGTEGWISIWAKGGSTGNGPKTAHCKRADGSGGSEASTAASSTN